MNVIHVGNTFVQLSQSTSLIVSEEMKCWRQWSKDTGRPWEKNHVSLRTDKQKQLHIVLFLFVGLFDLPTEVREWTGTDFQMSHIVLDSKKKKKKKKGIVDNYPSCAPTVTRKKCTFCFAVELVGKLIKLTCCPQRLHSMLLVNRPWKGCWNFHGFGIGWRGAAKQSKEDITGKICLTC